MLGSIPPIRSDSLEHSTLMKFRRSLSKKQLICQSADDARPSTHPLERVLPSKQFSTGYVTVTDKNDNYISFAHGEEVERGDEWGPSRESSQLDHESLRPLPSSRKHSILHLHQVGESLAGSSRFLHTAFEVAPRSTPLYRQPSKKARRQGKEAGRAGGSLSHVVIHSHPDPLVSKPESYLQKSKTLASIVGSVKQRFSPKTRVSALTNWDNRGKPCISEGMLANVLQWTTGQLNDALELQLVPLTPRQLTELRGKSMDAIHHAKSLYMVPSPTPCGSESGLVDTEEEEEDVFERVDDQDLLAEHKYLHRDLHKVIHSTTGFRIAPRTGDPDIVHMHSNYSPYYHQPLIEGGIEAHKDLISFVDMIDKDFELADALEYGYTPVSPGLETEIDVNFLMFKNTLQRPRSQLPGQALLQYLLFKGHSVEQVARTLALLDETFLYEHESRWWNEYRVPQHTQMNENIVEKILKAARAEKEWWEEEFDQAGGKMPSSQIILHRRQKERKVVRFARDSVENYFWWRLKGEQPHRSVRSGATTRDGEYRLIKALDEL